ncbi:MAG: transketolase [Rhodospirillales bacterium]|nr:MAG: transketolase [Rhodospirillales bacterium]
MRKACLNAVHDLARGDARVLYIGSDPGPGTLDKMRLEFPQRFFIEGISEQHVVGMAAGLAMEGYVPFVNTIATFLTRRCLEQVAIDVCLHKLPVRLIGNGGGVVYAPLGPTHTAIEDIALMRALPGMTVLCPADAVEMRQAVEATRQAAGPVYIRLGKGGDPVITKEDEPAFDLGKGRVKRLGEDALIVSTGIVTHNALEAATKLEAQGVACTVLHMPTVKPLDVETLLAHVQGKRLIVTAEEHVRAGGLGSAVLEALSDASALSCPLVRLGLPDRYLHNYGSQAQHLKHHGLDGEGIAKSVVSTL